ncbi:MAG: Sucraseferredoxin family protein [Nocardioides sp.]|nr:Sucraseferredoxin family protein [Nocardioides sp.]
MTHVPGPVDEGFRCSQASARAGEPMAGTAPTGTAWLFVEYAGPWARKAVAESRQPEDVRTLLDGLDDVRVQLIRRHGGVSGPGVRVFAAELGEATRVWTTVLRDVRELLDLDVAALAAGADPGLTPHDDLLWLVCTNGRRDLCCAELGRPIASALAARWPEATWETTHLGGHRFAGTLLALPSGVALGRLDVESAVAACTDLAAGLLPVDRARGRVGLAPAAQVAELHVRRELGLRDLGAVVVTSVDGEHVALTTPRGPVVVRVEVSPGVPGHQSCADPTTTAAPRYTIRARQPPQ